MPDSDGATVSDSYRVANVGRGLWYFIHIHAARSTGPEHIDILNAIIQSLADIFPCSGVCGSDLIDYLDSHGSIDPSSTPLEALRWTYDLHTSVNKRIHKPNASWEEVRHYFTADTPCGEFCNGKHAAAEAKPPPFHLQSEHRHRGQQHTGHSHRVQDGQGPMRTGQIRRLGSDDPPIKRYRLTE